MRRIRGGKPTPSMLVAIVALVFAIAGTSVAGVATISVLNKKEKKQTRKIARGEIAKAAPGLSVASAKTAQSANNAGSANSAANADNLDGLDSAAFPRVVARDTVNTDPPNLTPGACSVEQVDGGPWSGVRPDDLALVFQFANTGLVAHNTRQGTSGSVVFTLCNWGPNDVDAGSSFFEVLVLR